MGFAVLAVVQLHRHDSGNFQQHQQQPFEQLFGSDRNFGFQQHQQQPVQQLFGSDRNLGFEQHFALVLVVFADSVVLHWQQHHS